MTFGLTPTLACKLPTPLMPSWMPSRSGFEFSKYRLTRRISSAAEQCQYDLGFNLPDVLGPCAFRGFRFWLSSGRTFPWPWGIWFEVLGRLKLSIRRGSHLSTGSASSPGPTCSPKGALYQAWHNILAVIVQIPVDLLADPVQIPG